MDNANIFENIENSNELADLINELSGQIEVNKDETKSKIIEKSHNKKQRKRQEISNDLDKSTKKIKKISQEPKEDINEDKKENDVQGKQIKGKKGKKQKDEIESNDSIIEEKVAKKKKENTIESIAEIVNEEKSLKKTKKIEEEIDQNEKKKKRKKEETIDQIPTSNTTGNAKTKKDENVTSVKKQGETLSDKDIVLNYLIQQNRPYSVQNIFDNLHGNVKKKQLERILDSLSADKSIIMKEYNSKIYLAGQHHFQEIDKEELINLDKEIDESKDTITKLKEKKECLSNQLKFINAQLTDEEIDNQLRQYKKFLEKLQENLKLWESGEIEKIPDEKISEADKNYEQTKNTYKKIKKNCLNIIDFFCEGMEISKDELIKQMSGYENETELFNSLKNKQI